MKVVAVASFVMLASVAADARAQVAQGAQNGVLEPKEWTVPWERTRPRDPIMDQAGRVWFVGQTGNYVAYLDPKSGEFKRYQIDDGTNPHNVVVDQQGGVWYTGNRNGRIVKLNPETGELKNFMMPDSTVRDPHTLIFDKNGIGWFSAQQSQRIGRLDPKTGEIKLWRPPGEGRTNPYGVVVDQDGRPYFNLWQTNKIATIDPRTLEYKEFTHPDPRMRARRIAITSDGQIWFADYRGFLNHLDPKTGKFEEFPLPSGPAAQPYAHAQDDKDRIWIAETGVQPNKMVAFDTRTRSWVANFPVLSNGAARNTIRHMTFNRTTRELWFGTDAGTIGHVKVPVEMNKVVP
jgi:virginiamycin B lyase